LYRYFHGRPPSLAAIRERRNLYGCDLWHESDLAKVFEAPAQLTPVERMLLFSLVIGLRPKHAIEIGSFRGGSADIMVHAMDLNDHGSLTLIDPTPEISDELWSRIRHRATLIKAASPGALAGLSCDFAMIDATHETQAVKADLAAVRGAMSPGGVVLLHDAHYVEVRRGIEESLAGWIDCGLLTASATLDEEGRAWAGWRMLRRPET